MVAAMVRAAVPSSQSAVQTVVVFVAAAMAGDRGRAGYSRRRGGQRLTRADRGAGRCAGKRPSSGCAWRACVPWRPEPACSAGPAGGRRWRAPPPRAAVSADERQQKKLAPKNLAAGDTSIGAAHGRVTHTEGIAPVSSSLPLPLLAPGDRTVRLVKDGGWVGIRSSWAHGHIPCRRNPCASEDDGCTHAAQIAYGAVVVLLLLDLGQKLAQRVVRRRSWRRRGSLLRRRIDGGGRRE